MIKSVFAVFAAVVLLLAGACSGGDPVSVDDERPDTIAHGGMWSYHFTNLEEMTATADLVVSGEVTAVQRGRTLNADDPLSTTLTMRAATITIAETFRGTALGATVVMEQVAYNDDDGSSFEIAEMPWSRIGDKGVFFLKQDSTQPVDHYVQIVPDGRILTHHHVDGQSQPYETAEVFSHSALGTALGELAPEMVDGRIRQAVATVVNENIERQKSVPEFLAELDSDDNTGSSDNTGDSSDGTAPAAPGGITSDTGNNATTGQETP